MRTLPLTDWATSLDLSPASTPLIAIGNNGVYIRSLYILYISQCFKLLQIIYNVGNWYARSNLLFYIDRLCLCHVVNVDQLLPECLRSVLYWS